MKDQHSFFNNLPEKNNCLMMNLLDVGQNWNPHEENPQSL